MRPPTPASSAPAPADDEAARLAALRQYDIIDTAAEPAFDGPAAIAARVCRTPMAMVTLIDEHRQWFKARIGIDIPETPRCAAFCAQTILRKDVLVIPDVRLDARMADSPLVTGPPFFRFYAGAPLITSDGFALGALCVADVVPRDLTRDEIEALRALARQLVVELELRRTVRELHAAVQARDGYERALWESERFARATVDALTTHVAIVDEAGTIVATNEAWRRFAAANGGDPRGTGVGANYLAACEAAADGRGVAAGLRAVIRRERETFSEEYACHGPAAERWFVLRASRFAGDGPTRVVVAHEDVTARKRAELEAQFRARRDTLTRLPNRECFGDRLARALDRLKRSDRRRFAVLFLDLDRFKIVNDSLGHAAGDRLLLTVAAELMRETPGAAAGEGAGESLTTVARLGGDEFAVLLDGLACPEEAEVVAARLVAALSGVRAIDGHEVAVGVSIGVAHGDGRYGTAAEVVRDADVAMYHAKAGGKGRYAVFDQTMRAAAVTRLAMETDLRRAIDRQELGLVYQPVVSLRTRQVVGFEALARWDRPGHGQVDPGQFVPLAEETGLIVPLGRWVLETACRRLAAWRRLPGCGRLEMNVNLSRKQFSDAGLVPHVRRALDEAGLAGGGVNLEITETAVMDNGLARELLGRIRDAGVRLYMDDFGTGHSTLSCLHNFPFHGLKLDRSFLSKTPGQRDHAAVIQSIITLAQNLGMVVVGEGLETAEQVALLQSLDCDRGQGFYFARPLSAAEVEGQLTAEAWAAAYA